MRRVPALPRRQLEAHTFGGPTFEGGGWTTREGRKREAQALGLSAGYIRRYGSPALQDTSRWVRNRLGLAAMRDIRSVGDRPLFSRRSEVTALSLSWRFVASPS
jgi:hypothetical protein